MNLSMMMSACAGSAATTGVLMFSAWRHGTHRAGRPEAGAGARPAVRGVTGRLADVYGARKGGEAA
ncbi:hypothetical protein QFZ75_005858 [Streptomyces sp. V3I8]|uniref:hypothetical protein n=1 Tax=Streptomyces sp. V3I8 TaxID=3042279 RepID=UPI002783994F|nr:hypothetical protein [Streptomyces sp. V3I8]MDQ1039442.1 hypothetical protein [Streptomyces sp. V3I8]